MVIQMLIRLGYAVSCKTLENQHLFHTLTYTNYLKQEDNKKLEETIIANLDGLQEILKYNQKNNIHFYRLNSNLIPLATHNQVQFDYHHLIADKLRLLGQFIMQNQIRVDTHPDQFCVLNSAKEEVVKSSINILRQEKTIFDYLNIMNPRIILHIGSAEGTKKAGILRFIKNFQALDPDLQKMIIIENDDKIYDIKDTLELAECLNIPMVLDYHHYLCNNPLNLPIEDYILRIFQTWQSQKPKVHFSSPKSKLKKEFRTHHDYIDAQGFIAFLDKIKFCNIDFDVMIEAKMKDVALFRLVRELKYLTNYTFIDETTFRI